MLEFLVSYSSLIVVIGVIISMITWKTSQLKNDLERLRLESERVNGKIDHIYTMMISFMQNESKRNK